MYPQLFEKCGLSYSDLIDKLIELALKIIWNQYQVKSKCNFEININIL
jgi:hypothetical protein